jgi:hypothetical protein
MVPFEGRIDVLETELVTGLDDQLVAVVHRRLPLYASKHWALTGPEQP